MNEEKQLCEYGCGREAKYFLKRSKKWCCSKSYNSCPIAREKNRKSHLGENNHRYGKRCTDETKKIISEKNKGNIPWNKDKTNVYSKETLNKMSIAMTGRPGYWKGKKLPKEAIEKIRFSLKGNIPWNKGVPHNNETKNKISIKNKGIKRSKSFCENMSKNTKGNNNPNWKGGYSQNNIPLYNTYVNKLTIDDNPKRDKTDSNILTVICTKCGKRYIPKLTDVIYRCRCLKGTSHGEGRLYCSDECKHSCSIFNKSSNNTIDYYTDEEYQIFRQEVLQRQFDELGYNECEICSNKNNLHVHHEKPQKTHPHMTLDPDNGIILCEECHYEYGHKDECSTGNLAKMVCI